MNEEGSPLNRDEAVQHLALLANTPASSTVLTPRHDGAGSTSARAPQMGVKRIYVFDREHLDADPEEVAAALAVTEEAVLTEPPLNRECRLPNRSSSCRKAHTVACTAEDPLHSHLSLSLHNLQTLHALISAIQLQHASLALALSNLHRVNTGTASSFSLFLESAQPTMERYEALLTGWEESMDAVGKVAIVAGLLMRHASGGNTGHARDGSTSSVPQPEKQRYLGDYVSRDKMLAVRDGCAKVLGGFFGFCFRNNLHADRLKGRSGTQTSQRGAAGDARRGCRRHRGRSGRSRGDQVRSVAALLVPSQLTRFV